MLDTGQRSQIAKYSDMAAKCRRLAARALNYETLKTLIEMAVELEEEAKRLHAQPTSEQQ
jgi:hypothetical protein